MSPQYVPKKGPDYEEEQTICFCHNVPYKRIVEVIRGGATSLVDIQEKTCASTGCGGCECDVLDILESELGPKKPVEE